MLALLLVLLVATTLLTAVLSQKVIRLHVVGSGDITEKLRVVESLLGDHQRIKESDTLQLYKPIAVADDADESAPSPLLLITSGAVDKENVTSTDVPLLFLSESTMLDENVIINRMRECYSALKLGEETGPVERKRSPLLILYSGSASVVGRIELLLKEAWQLDHYSSKGDFSSVNIVSVLDVRVFLVPTKLKAGESSGIEAINSLKSVIQNCIPTASVIDEGFYAAFDTIEPREASFVTTVKSYGIENSGMASEVAYMWAMKAANASVERLNKLGPAEEFSGYMSNLVKRASETYGTWVYVGIRGYKYTSYLSFLHFVHITCPHTHTQTQF